MKDIHLINAAQATPFVETLTRLGAPVEALSRQAGLPLEAVRDGRGVIGERSLWRFLEFATESEGLEFLGYLTALDHPVTSAAQLGGLRLRQAPKLERLLEYFIQDVRGEASAANYSLRREDSESWFHRQPAFEDSSASWQAEQYVICFVIQIVRLCAQADWLPSRIRICSCAAPCPVPAEWASIEFEWGRKATEIHLSASALALPPRNVDLLDHSRRDDGSAPLRIDDLVDRQIWSGTVGLDQAAHELGFSATTLKRRLAEEGPSYSDILERRKDRWARHLLTQTDLSIAEVARSLGYRHPGNFTRAFARMSGVSPSRYRDGIRPSAKKTC